MLKILENKDNNDEKDGKVARDNQNRRRNIRARFCITIQITSRSTDLMTPSIAIFPHTEGKRKRKEF